MALKVKSIFGRFLGFNPTTGDLVGLGASNGQEVMVRAANNRVANVTASTLTVTADDHDGKVVKLNRAAGIAVTLPAATGSGSLYRFEVGTTITSNTTTIKVANSSDTMQGGAAMCGQTTTFNFPTAATSDTITFNGTSTGGVLGSYAEVEDVATNVYSVRVFAVGTAVAAATPFSATV